jgi:hypothetical protein
VTRATIPSVIELSWEDREGRVKVILPDRHVMAMPVMAAVEACRAFRDQYIFQGQFELLLDHLAQWLKDHRSVLASAYLTVRDAGLLFAVVRKDRVYDDHFEEALTDLDLEIANDSAYSLIRLDVLALPYVSDESVQCFLAAGNTFRYIMDG